MVPGPGGDTAAVPRTTPSPMAAPTRTQGSNRRGATVAQSRHEPASAQASRINPAPDGDAANPTLQPPAKPPHVQDAQRPAREPASRLTAGAARPAGSAPDR